MPRTKKNPEVTEEVKTEKPVKAAAKKPAAKAKAAKLEIFIQSPMGGNITPEEIAAKLPKGARASSSASTRTSSGGSTVKKPAPWISGN